MTTVHANSARDAISRLETMVLMAGFDLPVRAIREQIALGHRPHPAGRPHARRPPRRHLGHRGAGPGGRHDPAAGHLQVPAPPRRRARAGPPASSWPPGLRPKFLDKLDRARRSRCRRPSFKAPAGVAPGAAVRQHRAAARSASPTPARSPTASGCADGADPGRGHGRWSGGGLALLVVGVLLRASTTARSSSPTSSTCRGASATSTSTPSSSSTRSHRREHHRRRRQAGRPGRRARAALLTLLERARVPVRPGRVRAVRRRRRRLVARRARRRAHRRARRSASPACSSARSLAIAYLNRRIASAASASSRSSSPTRSRSSPRRCRPATRSSGRSR